MNLMNYSSGMYTTLLSCRSLNIIMTSSRARTRQNDMIINDDKQLMCIIYFTLIIYFTVIAVFLLEIGGTTWNKSIIVNEWDNKWITFATYNFTYHRYSVNHASCLCPQVGVLSPLGRNFYLNITPNNLVHLYLHADAVAPGSARSVRVRELSSADWDSTMLSRVTEPSCSSRSLPNIQLPVTNCINGRIAPSCVISSTASIPVKDMMQQQKSLSELVGSLRNCTSVRTQAFSHVELSSAHGNNLSSSSLVPRSSCYNPSKADSLHHLQTASFILHDQSKVLNSRPRFSSSRIPVAPQRALNMPPASQCSPTPSQVKRLLQTA